MGVPLILFDERIGQTKTFGVTENDFAKARGHAVPELGPGLVLWQNATARTRSFRNRTLQILGVPLGLP